MRVRAAVLPAAVLAISGAASTQAQDSVPSVRHLLAIDYARVHPFRRAYDIVVASGDSTVQIGRRDVAFVEAVSDSSRGWLLVESRSGAVNSLDSILLTPDLRPLRWRSVVGAAVLDLAFSADSLNGSVRVGAAASPLALVIPPDLVISASTLELIAAVLPLQEAWMDSANALTIDLGGAAVRPAELAVSGIGLDSVVVVPQLPARPCWLLSMRSNAHESLLWVDRETADVLRVQTSLPSHVGTVLQYRIRPQSPVTP